jgi:cytochrome c nitrite reductase small subunit
MRAILRRLRDGLNATVAMHARASMVIAVLVGLLAGIGGFTFLYAEGLSYMSSDAKVCVNCHVMQPQYDAWQKASHHNVAVCIDCHLPHPFFRKYIAKAQTGFHDSVAFTLQNFHEPIMMTPKGAAILQETCVSCHAPLMHDQLATSEVQCVHCHRNVGHGPMTGMGRLQ